MAVRRVFAGERVVDPGLAISALFEGDDPLTPRQKEILRAARDSQDGCRAIVKKNNAMKALEPPKNTASWAPPSVRSRTWCAHRTASTTTVAMPTITSRLGSSWDLVCAPSCIQPQCSRTLGDWCAPERPEVERPGRPEAVRRHLTSPCEGRSTRTTPTWSPFASGYQRPDTTQ